jgi:hypothetical protein
MLFLLLLSSFLMMSSGIDVSSMPFQAIIIREAEAASRIGHDPELNTENATGEVENAVERFEASDLEACEDEDESTLTTTVMVNSMMPFAGSGKRNVDDATWAQYPGRSTAW